MATPLISVIVPVYKVEPYLDRCVQSIVDQTYTNLEIILVDDGSPDNCPAMCDAWAAKDSRIRVIHKANGGLSDARNAGMAIAKGEYIGFVDSDDWISEDMYALLMADMVKNGSDISACGVRMVFEDDSPDKSLTPAGSAVLNSEEAMTALIREDLLKQPVWYKLYKSELAKDILFPVGKYHEDVFWSYLAIGKANRVSVFDTPCYFYTQRTGSIMGQGYSLKRLDALEAKVLRLEYVRQNYSALENEASVDLLFSCVYHGQMVDKNLPRRDRAKINDCLRRTVESIDVKMASLSFYRKCWVWFAIFNFKLCCKLRNLMGIGL